MLLVALLALAAAGVMAVVLVQMRSLRRAEQTDLRLEAAELRRRFAGVLAIGRDGIVVHTPAGRIVDVNEAAADVLGVHPAETGGRTVAEIPVRWLTESGQEMSPAGVFAHRRNADGTPAGAVVVAAASHDLLRMRWVQVSTRTIPTADGGHELVTCLADVTGPRELRAALARSEKQFHAAMENAPTGMAIADPQWRLEQVNLAFAELLGTRADALVGKDLSGVSHAEDRAAERAGVQRLLQGDLPRLTLEKRYVRADGQTVWVVLDAVLVRTPDGAPENFVVQMRDITDSRMHSEMLAHRAMHDPLTGLANRALMQDALQRAAEGPDAAGRVAVIVVDLDEFKQINDRFGHPAGDEVLVHVAGVLRAATAGRGTVARLGGDEFVIVVEHPDAPRVVFEVAAGIHHGLRNPVRTAQRRLPVRASVGVAVADPALLSGGGMALLAAADAAVYRAKAGGRSRTEVYDSSMAMPGVTKHGAAAELSDAIARGQLVLHYQPTVDLATGKVVGQEALVRWQHPTKGLLLPGAFLPTAVEAGLGVALGATVVEQACAYLVRTRALHWVSVNVSADQLGDGQLTAAILEAMRRHRIPRGKLSVELTEAGVVEAGSRIKQELAELRAAGVPVLLDDFGTGAAPLAYLRDLPVDGVKLDMSFTAGIPEDPAAARISRALGALARELGMLTIAEGVETREQAEFLRQCGWRHGQGWLFGAGQSETVTLAQATR